MLHSHNRKLSFRLPPVRILGSMECGRSRNDCFRSSASKNNIKLKKIMQKIQRNKRYINTESTLEVEIENYQWKVLLLNIFQVRWYC